MNSKECVSRGAALQCAMLSPVFKVRRRGGAGVVVQGQGQAVAAQGQGQAAAGDTGR